MSELETLRNQPPPPLRSAPGRIIATPWPAMDRQDYRAGYGLTPERLYTAFRAADQGQLAYQCDVFEELLLADGHTCGQYLSRMSSVAMRPWVMQPGADDTASVEAAQLLGRAMRRANTFEMLWHSMDGTFYGHGASNTQWKYDPDLDAVVPAWFVCVPHRRMTTDERDRLRLRTEENTWPGEELRIGEWVQAVRPHRKISRAGLLRVCAWWCVFKRLQIRDWMVFAEKFGIPMAIGYYDGRRAGETTRQALLAAVTDIGTDGQAVLEDTCRIAIEGVQMRNGDVSSLHPVIAARCDAEISKVLTGATLNVETGGPGSFALGKVHESRSTSLSFSDAFWLDMIFQRDIAKPFLAYNPAFAKAEPPRLSIQVQPDMDPLTQSQVYMNLQQMGLEIDPEQMYERFGLRAPPAGRALKPPEPAAPSKPPGGGSKGKAQIRQPRLARADEVTLGTKISIKPERRHEESHSEGVVEEINAGPALGVRFEGMGDGDEMSGVHRWYVPDEVDLAKE